ncbi:MAG: DUF6695 family protein [Bacteroidales bacterium]|nr:DUF6695 family protein [Bacteroidales bacterium]
MLRQKRRTGFAIAIAWPELYCKQSGGWYEPITRFLGINRNNYYRAGHAAIVLIDVSNTKCHYFDFGRYHAPFDHGRVRGALTDHELAVRTIPVISADGNTIINFEDIVNELQLNPACHGEGNIHASYCPIDFRAAYEKVTQMQDAHFWPYGPFRYKGSNCSRFVNTAILAGKPAFRHRFKLRWLVPLTPTPLNNVNSLNHKVVLPKLLTTQPFIPLRKLEKEQIKSTLPQPVRNPKIPENAKWLSGEGAGSWFVVKPRGETFEITRYSPSGVVECTGHFGTSNGTSFNPDDSVRLGYPSNCKEVTLLKGQEVLWLERIS